MNEYLHPNLKSLIGKVYDEGIEKAKNKARQIIADAQQQSSELTRKAEEQIAGKEAQSQDEIIRTKERIDNDLKSAARQTISTLKEELSNVLSKKITAKAMGDVLNEKEFLQQMILSVLQKWNSENNALELLLNQNDKVRLTDFFEQQLKKELATELEIVVENKIRSGFKIAVKKEGYYVSFSNEDFENFFKSFLHSKTIELIYGNKANE